MPRINRAGLRRHVRADHGRPSALGRHRALPTSRSRPHDLRRRGQIRWRQSDPRRHGPEPARRLEQSSTRSSPTPSSSIIGASSRPTSASATGASWALARAATPTCSPASTFVIGPGTEVIAGEGLIATPAGIDSHIHFICPQQIDDALMSGVTTMIGGGTGPAAGTNATTCTPGLGTSSACCRRRTRCP